MSWIDRIRSRAREQSGQALVITGIAMFALLGIAAMAIDAASWYQKHHQAQVAADAASLAAANCLANAGTGKTCTSTTDTVDAQAVAVTIAAKNGLSITAADVDVNTTAGTVSVADSSTTPSILAGIGGVKTASQAANATASYVGPASQTCTTVGSTCAAVYASDTACGTTGSPRYSVTLNGSGDSILGGVYSNGGIDEVGGSQTLGPTAYGTGAACTINTNGSSGDTWNGSKTAPSHGSTPFTSWPDDYSLTLSACGSGYAYACTGPGGTPSWCTASKANYTFGSGGDALSTNQVYCATGSGTGVVASNPATWTGVIEFQSGNLGSSSIPIPGTFVGGTIDVDHKSYLTVSNSAYPLFYAVGGGTCSSATVGGICMPASGSQLTGAMYAPNGTINFDGNGSSGVFLEALDVVFTGGSQTIEGDGPTGAGGSTPGQDSLVQ